MMQNLQNTKTLFIGSTDEYLSDCALSFDNQAFLIDKKNYKQFILADTKITAYTSLGDLPKNTNIFYNLLDSATEIHYCPPENWIKQKNETANLYLHTDSEQHLIEGFLIYFSTKKKIIGLNHINDCHSRLSIHNKRNTSDNTLWIAGCSNSKGSGVRAEESYACLLSNSLRINCVNLAKSGTSNLWSADQILRSDIRKNDIVIWGLTSVERISYIHDNKLNTFTPAYYLKNSQAKNILHPKHLLSENTFYQTLAAIEQVSNFCKKTQAKFYCFLTFPTDIRLTKFLFRKDYFMNFNFDFTINEKDNSWHETRKDLGTDKTHPGPLHHQHWHNLILKHLQNQAH